MCETMIPPHTSNSCSNNLWTFLCWCAHSFTFPISEEDREVTMSQLLYETGSWPTVTGEMCIFLP